MTRRGFSWRNVYQPRNPLFWIMLTLNGLSLMLGWITQTRTLTVWASLLVGIFAIGNALLGSWLLWRLLSTSPQPDVPPPAPSKDKPTS